MKNQQTIERYLSDQDPILASLIQKYGECPFLKDTPVPDLFDQLASSIIGQQLSTKAAGSIRATLLKQATSATFSTAFFLNTTPEDLRSYGLSMAKAKTLHELSTKVHSTPDFLTQMQALNTDEISRILCAIKGIGPWTAKMFQMFALRRLDVFAPEDAGIIRGIRLTYSDENTLDPFILDMITSRWAPYKTIASWYMWQVANDQPRKLSPKHWNNHQR
jgi:DNA-3-methyladenine glycosylase II